MRLYEFTNKQSINVLELLLCDYRRLIEEINLPLSEDTSNDRNNYLEFIDQEKQYCISFDQLIKGQTYAPLSLLGSPANSAMAIRTTKDDVEFDSLQNQIIFLKPNGQTAIFPPNNITKDDTSVDTLVFKNQADKKEFLTTLNLKFNGWKFYTNYI